MTKESTLRPWQHTAAVAVEGVGLLAALLPRLLAAWWLLQPPALPSFPAPAEALLPLAAQALLYGLLLAPMRLGRLSWYQALQSTNGRGWPGARAFLTGWRHWLTAVRWRWQLWWRRTSALALAILPTALLWSYGARSDAYAPLLWLLWGGLLLPVGLGAAALWLCRYALAPFLLLEGYPAGAALQLSVRGMRRHRGHYLNFLGSWAGPLLSCLLLVPAVFVLPRFRLAHTALLSAWLPDAHPQPGKGSSPANR